MRARPNRPMSRRDQSVGPHLRDIYLLMTQLLYGSGIRIGECNPEGKLEKRLPRPPKKLVPIHAKE